MGAGSPSSSVSLESGPDADATDGSELFALFVMFSGATLFVSTDMTPSADALLSSAIRGCVSVELFAVVLPLNSPSQTTE